MSPPSFLYSPYPDKIVEMLSNSEVALEKQMLLLIERLLITKGVKTGD
jgi:hypothetical protein